MSARTGAENFPRPLTGVPAIFHDRDMTDTRSPLRVARENAGLTQKELAHRAGCSRRTIIRWEQAGEAFGDDVSRLADALGVSTDALLGRTGTAPLGPGGAA